MNPENYFLNCHTEESVKIRFKLLAKEHHPDKNKGNEVSAVKLFQEITNQRDNAIKKIYLKEGKSPEETEAALKTLIKDLDNFDFSNSQTVADSLTAELDAMYGEGNYTVAQVAKHVFGKLFGTARKMKNINGSAPDQKKIQ